MKIEHGTYSGYVWMSDSPQPKVLRNEDFELEIADDNNPFVVEAQLFSDKNVSISVKYVDGKYIIQKYENVNMDLESETESVKEYVANSKIGGTLVFLQYWEEVKDEEEHPTRCGMNELRPGKLVFVGFKEKEKEAAI